MRFYHLILFLGHTLAEVFSDEIIPEYNIKLFEEQREHSPDAQTIHIRQFGQDYVCSLPSKLTHAKTIEYVNQMEERVSSDLKLAVDIIKSLGTKYDKKYDNCLHRLSGYWSTCFCLFSDVSQYRSLDSKLLESGITRIDFNQPHFKLASFDNVDWEDYSNFKLNTNGAKTRYLEQTLTGGDICDKTGKERVAKVHYMCDPEHKFPSILEIREIKTCVYEISVSYPELCRVYPFMNSMFTVEQITCSLIAKDEEHNKIEQNGSDHLNLRDLNLINLGHNLYMGIHETLGLPTVLITSKKIDAANLEEIDDLLQDCLFAMIDLEKRKQLLSPLENNKESFVSQKDTFKYTVSLYGIGGVHICDLMMEQKSDKQIVAEVITGIEPKNFIEFNGIEIIHDS
ncbi:hypothetical protein OGAPHI_002308 [Ogataea philodendri]|uniref:Endoplasmic reticulum lectin n=1 Tax=Ogataea philodendri TaxID=1378263 RepID=A0A9P8T7K4_9ASCO|nr:uncharacterized protein OGAPHI_002308 [Ogataea philodendri]KAH3668554.1 hypothetical protein OGAPHI_002308 [Ogataea philodendri]